MGALESSFDDTTDEMEKHTKMLDQLERKSEALTDAVEQMQNMVDRAVEKYGEGSTEALKWEASLADTEKALADTNKEIENQQQAIENLQSPMGELTQTMSDQQSELDQLKDAYVDAWLNGEAGRCAELAGEIETLSGALATNQQAMADAKAEADGFDQTITKIDGVAESEGKVEEGSEKMSGAFGSSMMSMASSIADANVTDLVGQIIDKVMELVDGAIEVQNAFDDSMQQIVYGTGLTGDALDDMAEHAKKAWAAVADSNGSVEDAGSVMAALNTRLGLTGDAAQGAAETVLKFAKVTGENGADAVNKAVDVMKQWGMVTGDATTDVETLNGIMDQFLVASQTSDINISTMANSLTKQAGAWKDLGFDMNDAIALMVQYEDAGGNASTLTSSLRTVISQLSDETGDCGAAFQDIIAKMQSGGDTADILNQKIAGTDITIEKAFGKSRAQEMINTFQAMGQNTTDWAATLQSAGGQLESTYQASIDTADGVAFISNAFEEATGLSGDFLVEAMKMNGMYQLLADTGKAMAASTTANYKDMKDSSSDTTKSADADAKQQVASAKTIEAGTKTAYQNASNAVRTATTQEISATESMKNRTAANYSAAAGSVSSSCNSMVGSLNNVKANSDIWVSAHGSLPYIVDNKGNTAISYSIAGYTRFARGYDQAMLLNSPTLFGLIGGDRPGSEVVVGESHLLDMIGQTIRSAFGYVPAAAGGGSTTNNYSSSPTINVYGAPGQDVRELANIIEQKISRNVNRRSAVW